MTAEGYGVVDLCPQCGGRRLYTLVYQHSIACPLLARQDARQITDADLFGRACGVQYRGLTDTERTLLSSLDGIDSATLPLSVRLVKTSPAVILTYFGDPIDARLDRDSPSVSL